MTQNNIHKITKLSIYHKYDNLFLYYLCVILAL